MKLTNDINYHIELIINCLFIILALKKAYLDIIGINADNEYNSIQLENEEDDSSHMNQVYNMCFSKNEKKSK